MSAPLPNPPYFGIEWDDELEKTPLATRAIVRGALRIERWLIEKAPSTILSVAILQGFHRTMFGDVFPDFSGRIRGPSPQYIPYAVTFGNYRGEIHDRVPDACDRLINISTHLIHQLDRLKITMGDADFDTEVLKVAAFVHCEIIRIHPFINGNGRVARICINYFAARYGYLPVPLERPKGEYLDANRTWLQHKRIEHFIEFLRPGWQRKPVAPEHD